MKLEEVSELCIVSCITIHFLFSSAKEFEGLETLFSNVAGDSTQLASEQSERDTTRGVQIRAGTIYVYIYMYGGWHNSSSACHAYIMWAEYATAIFYTCQPFQT